MLNNSSFPKLSNNRTRALSSRSQSLSARIIDWFTIESSCACSSIFERCSFFHASSCRRPLILLISVYRTLSSTLRILEHSFIYTDRTILSGMIAIERTISVIRLALLTGSFLASAKSRFVLKTIKSVSFFSIYCVNSVELMVLENESGSSPSGNNRTFTLSSCSKTKSIPLREALIPAGSPSYIMVILLENRFTNRT